MSRSSRYYKAGTESHVKAFCFYPCVQCRSESPARRDRAGITLESLLGGTVFQPFLTALLGLIPNCAASILITQLFLEGAISFGSAVAGLCTGAGIGLVVLFKTSRNKKECFAITGILYLIAVIAGMILQLIG